MRAVYDTSLLATIVSRRGIIHQLQADVSTSKVSLVTSPFILGELERILVAKFGLTKQGAKLRTRLLSRVANVVQPKRIAPVSRDTNDDPIIATAITGQAEYIVTFDYDLLVLKKHEDIQIVTPDDFKKIISA